MDLTALDILEQELRPTVDFFLRMEAEVEKSDVTNYEEVVAENVRVLRDGETVSVDGTHLGHNLPDPHGNRYCINLVCVAGPDVR